MKMKMTCARFQMVHLQMQHIQRLFLFVILACCTKYAIPYTYEPPGRDPVSIDNVRSSEEAVQLTTANFDELTKGKIIFVKIYSPYCPHCKEIAGDWNKLAKYYQELPDSDDILIGSIDCTDSPKGKDLCAKFKVLGLPTFLYGDASFGGVYLEEYPRGDKTFEEFKSFAAEALVPTCHPGNLDACSRDVRPQVKKYMKMPYKKLDKLIKETEKKEENVKISFKDEQSKLQKNYDQKLMEKELQVTKARGNSKLIKEVMAMKQ